MIRWLGQGQDCNELQKNYDLIKDLVSVSDAYKQQIYDKLVACHQAHPAQIPEPKPITSEQFPSAPPTLEPLPPWLKTASDSPTRNTTVRDTREAPPAKTNIRDTREAPPATTTKKNSNTGVVVAGLAVAAGVAWLIWG